MQINMSKLDRVLRVFVALAFLILFYTGAITGTMGTIGLVLAALLLGTVTFGYCPLYTLLGISSCPNKP
jgi:ABC-type proline/glycine betaine transport system permease subunit